MHCTNTNAHSSGTQSVSTSIVAPNWRYDLAL
ncbi:MAG: CxxxxCH/CxxCH domain-containing protein [Bacteroidetes bacterium]|nr:MAG: CxxxxCH/CxxCH domain-containing protein [Bacteroidota bacterium]